MHKGQHIVLDIGSSYGETVIREIDADEVCIEVKGRKYGSVVLYNNASKATPISDSSEDQLQRQ